MYRRTLPALLQAAFATIFAIVLSPLAPAQSESAIRRAVERALPPLEASAAKFVAERACFSCHHNALPIMMLRSAQERGFDVNRSTLAAIERRTFVPFEGPSAFESAVQAETLTDPTPNESLLLMAAQAAGQPRDLTKEVYARRLASWQRDGHWVTSDFRPPHSSSLFTATATALIAIQAFLPEELDDELRARMEAAERWLTDTEPISTEDSAFRLLGLYVADAPGITLREARADLLKRQNPDGGWQQLPFYDSDAYSTGVALWVMERTGTPVINDAWRKGIKWLVDDQERDGTWHVKTRMISPAQVSPPYFETGFPYGSDEFISYAGSSWAAIALLRALPLAEDAVNPVAPPLRDEQPAWVRTAMFGRMRDFTALLDQGLDPNMRLPGGTSLLMLVAPDPERVGMLLERGADAKARADSGADAITIAAAYRDTAESVSQLLERGANAETPAATAPEDVRAANSPLAFASMTGDLAVVRLLLEHGANPMKSAPQSGMPIINAITFGYADVTEELIAAGASVGLVEGSGVNLLHWATITNRWEIIPILVANGVPVDEMDGAGFTPLMYASTINFGEGHALDALIRAGADLTLKNPDGLTALEQTRKLNYAHLATLLRQAGQR